MLTKLSLKIFNNSDNGIKRFLRICGNSLYIIVPCKEEILVGKQYGIHEQTLIKSL